MAFTNPLYKRVRDEHYTTYTTANRVLSLFPPEFFAGKMIDCCCDGWFDGDEGAHGLNEVVYYDSKRGGTWNPYVKHSSEIVNWLRDKIIAGRIEPESITLSGYTGPQGKEEDALLAPQYGMSWQQLNLKKYDLVITNPPFSDNQGIGLLKKCVDNGNDFILWNYYRRAVNIDFLRLLAAGKVYLAVRDTVMEFQVPKGQHGKDAYRQVNCDIYTSQPVWQGEGAPKGKTLSTRQRLDKLSKAYHEQEQHIDFPLRYNKRIYRKGAPTMLPVKNVQWVKDDYYKKYHLAARLPLYGSRSVPFKSGIYLVSGLSFLDGYLYQTSTAAKPMNYRILGLMFPYILIEVIA